MAKSIEPSPDIRIAALENQPRAGIVYDLTRPGEGVPWEDRGTLGVIGAFVKTATQSMARPALLLDHIRRPDTTSDAAAFVIVCGALWSVSVLVHNLLLLWRYRHNAQLEVAMDRYLIATVLQVLVTTPVVFALLKLSTGIYRKLIEAEVKTQVPRPLIYNLFAYSLGPSLVAPIPLIGPIIALIWIFIDLVIVGRKRLFISAKGAVIGALIALGVALGALLAGYLIVGLVWSQVTSGSVTTIAPQPKALRR